MKKNSYLISAAILLIFAYFLYRYGVFKKLPEIFESLDLKLLVLSILSYIFTYCLRALRFSLIFPSIKVSQMVAVMGVHTFFNNVLPFRSGEASFPIILKKLFGVETHASSTALLFVRLLDLLSLSLIFSFSVFTVSLKERKLLWFSGGIFILLILTTWMLLKILNKLKNRFKLIASVLAFLSTFISISKLFRLIAYSFLNWLTKFFSFYLIFKAAKVNLSFPQTVFISTFGELTTILPIHSFGGFGTYEAGLVGGFKLLGVKTSTALTVAFYFHLILLLMSGMLAFFGWIYLSKTVLEKISWKN